MKLHVGASLIRQIINSLPTLEEKVAFISLIWPDLHPLYRVLIAKYPDETSVSGSELKLPPSWDEIVEDHA